MVSEREDDCECVEGENIIRDRCDIKSEQYTKLVLWERAHAICYRYISPRTYYPKRNEE